MIFPVSAQRNQIVGSRAATFAALALLGGLLTGGCSSYQDLHPNDTWMQRPAPEPETPTEATPAPTPAPSTPTPVVATPTLPQPVTDPSSAIGIMELMQRAADWQLANLPEGTEARKGWVCAPFYDGVMALGRLGGNANDKYVEAMFQIGTTNRWQPGQRIYNADDHAVTQMYLEMYELRGDPALLQPTQGTFNIIFDAPKLNPDDLDFSKPGHDDKWSWCDSLFMDPPAWARLTKITGDPKYLDSANERWWATSQYLFDPKEHLFYRDSTFFTKREKGNGEKIFWARGNGWVLAGLARMMDYMPKDYGDRPKYEKQFRDMAAKIMSLQQADGFWRVGLLDPDSYNYQEESGTAFFTYGLAWGINNGLLDKTVYLPVVMKAWFALVSCEQKDGKIIHVQPVGAQPSGFDPDSTAPFGVGAFLLAGGEVYKLLGGK